jgi:hypothetical protein
LEFSENSLADWEEEFMECSDTKFSQRLDMILPLGKFDWKFQSKLLRNPEQNGWEVFNTGAIISSNGLLANNNIGTWRNVIAKKGFPITEELSRKDNFPGTILYYFEVTNMSNFR